MNKDLAASVRARLLNIAKAEGSDFNQVLVRYALERFLYRLSQSSHADRFLLKGALLFTLWYDMPHRPTRDADLLGFGPSDLESIGQTFRDIASITVDDGIIFDPNSLSAEEIRKNAGYAGARVVITGELATLAADGAFLADGTFAALPPVPEALLLEIFRRAVLAFLVREHALSEDLRSRMLGWRYSGFSVHNQVRIGAEDAGGRKKLAGYMLRAPMSLAKMTYDAHHRHRHLPLEDAPQAQEELSDAPALGASPIEPVSEPASAFAAHARSAWARLIRKVYEADPLECQKCHGPMRIIALIDDPPVMRRILEHLGLWQPEAMERSPPLPPEAWPLNSVLPMTYHPVPDIA